MIAQLKQMPNPEECQPPAQGNTPFHDDADLVITLERRRRRSTRAEFLPNLKLVPKLRSFYGCVRSLGTWKPPFQNCTCIRVLQQRHFSRQFVRRFHLFKEAIHCIKGSWNCIESWQPRACFADGSHHIVSILQNIFCEKKT